ncbi:MAG: hypothetical protein WC840_05295 [Candidatus Peribacteraceae bacterium]
MGKNKIIIFAILLSLFSISCAKGGLTETASFSKIHKLPEVQSFIEKIGRVEGVRPVIRQEESSAENANLFEYYVGESYPTHSVLWNRFAVDKKTSEVFVFDIESGDYISIEKWREKQK